MCCHIVGFVLVAVYAGILWAGTNIGVLDIDLSGGTIPKTDGAIESKGNGFSAEPLAEYTAIAGKFVRDHPGFNILMVSSVVGMVLSYFESKSNRQFDKPVFLAFVVLALVVSQF